MSTKNNKLRFIDEEKTKELQKDWKGYGKSQVLFGIVVFVALKVSFITCPSAFMFPGIDSVPVSGFMIQGLPAVLFCRLSVYFGRLCRCRSPG